MIGQQRLGRRGELDYGDTVPGGGSGTPLQDTWEAEHLCTCWIIGVQIDNTSSPPVAFSVDAYLWARDFEWDIWGRLGENDGAMNGGNPLTGTGINAWWFVYQNLEVWKDVYVQFIGLVGGEDVLVYLYPMYEQASELRGL